MAKPKVGPSQNVYGMIERVLITSMSKGQAPLFVLAGIFSLMIWKMPPEDVSKLVFRLMDMLQQGYYVGYVASAILTFGWFAHAKYQRRTMNAEIERLSALRTQLQAKTIAILESSEHD